VGLWGAMLGRQRFTGAPRAGLSSVGLSICALAHGWLSPGDGGGWELRTVTSQKHHHTGAGVEHTFPMEIAGLVKQHRVGSEILVVMCKVGLVLLVQLPTSLLHTLCHSRRTTAEHPDLLHLGKEGAKGVKPSSTGSLSSPAPLGPLPFGSFGHRHQLSSLPRLKRLSGCCHIPLDPLGPWRKDGRSAVGFSP